MNVPVQSRKPVNPPSYKRDIHYSSHQSPPGNLQDGMNFAGLGSQTLQATQSVAVTPSLNPQTQHASPYLQQTNTLGNAPTHPSSATAYHIQPHGQTNNTQTTLQTLTHSQGPTPSSTPPAVPNDQKGPSNYAPYPPMSHLYRQIPQSPFIVNSANGRNHTRGMTPMRSGNQLYLIGTPTGPPYPFVQIPSAAAGQLNQITSHGAFAAPPQQFPMTHGTSSTEHHPSMAYYQIPSQNAAGPSPTYNNYITRPAAHWSSNQPRQPTSVPGLPPTMLPNPPIYGNISVPMPQPQHPQQQPASSKQKERSRAIPIIDPETREEVDVGRNRAASDASKSNEEKSKEAEDNRASKKQFQEEVKKLAAEPSSGSSNHNAGVPPTSSSSYVNSEKATTTTTPTTTIPSSSVPNGMVTPAVTTQQQKCVSPPAAASSSDTNRTPSQNNNNSLSNNSNTISSDNAPATNSLPKAAQHAAAGTQPAKMDFKRPTREDQNLVAAANTVAAAAAASKTTMASNISSQGVEPMRITTAPKKISKESESTLSETVVGSSTLSAAAVSTATTVPNVSSQDGLINVETVTKSLDNAESIQKAAAATTKQGTQDGGVAENGATCPKSTTAATISKQASTENAASSPLPVMSTSQSAAQSNLKTDTRSQPLADAKMVAGSKIGSPIDEKQAVKDEKSNPYAKTKTGRGKEASANDVVDQLSFGKTAQLLPKTHQDSAKQTTTTTSTPTKQTNGESQEMHGASEGKSRAKNKKGNKKEINRKGLEKEGSDMDVFTGLERNSPVDTTMTTTTTTTTITAPPKVNESDKPTAAQQDVFNDAIRDNSSQRFTNDIKENANTVAESIEIVNTSICPNIPAAAPLAPATRNLELPDKTEEQMPMNDGKPSRRVYTIEFLMRLRNQPHCTQPVKLNTNLPYIFYADTRRNASQNGFAPNNMFMPSFGNQSHSQSMRGSMVSTRKSQQGTKRDRPSAIHFSLSLRDDVQLRSSKNAWKPARLNPDLKTMSTDEKKTEELYKATRGILNKITPEKFATLVDKIKQLATNIDTAPRLQGVIDLMFQKAIDEPGFCRCYAEMCQVIQHVSVPDENNPEKPVTIRSSLIGKCQNQFERDKTDELNATIRLKEIQACTDPEKKKELQLEFEEMERRLRRQSVGNCRFIGELFKLGMLTSKIMMRCINQLVAQIDEESLECLCKLLSTIGRDLEFVQKVDKGMFDSIFSKMRDISTKKSYNVSSRIRFMLQDVIDLRKNSWKPRRDDNPKTIEQLNQEFEKEEMEARLNLQMPRKYDDNNYNRNSRDHKRNNRNDNKMANDNTWQVVQTKGSYQKLSTSKVDRSKLEQLNIAATDELALGPPSFSNWRTGVQSKGTEKKQTNYPFAAPPSMKAPMQRLTPSNSVERSRPPQMPRDDNTMKTIRSSSSQNASIVAPGPPIPAASCNVSQTVSSVEVDEPVIVESESVKLNRYYKMLVDELDMHRKADDSALDFAAKFVSSSPQQLSDAVAGIVNYLLDKKPKLSNLCGKMFSRLLRDKSLYLHNILDGLSPTLEMADDILIDFPKLWVFLAEILSPPIIEDCLSYSEFEIAFVDKFPEQRNGPILKAVNEIISKFPSFKKSLLLEKLKNEDYDNIRKWIDVNFENGRKNPQFVQILTEAVCEYYLLDIKEEDGETPKYFIDKIGPLFRFYVENEADLEMSCLVTVYKFAERKEFPQGFLLYIFNALFNSKSISLDAFTAWKKQASNFHGGAGTMSLRSFYEFLEGQNSS